MPWTRIQIEREEPAFDEHAGEDVRKLEFGPALREALDQALGCDPRVIAMGQGMNDASGIFGSTTDLYKKYGVERVFDTPLNEESTVGIAIGAAMAGMRPVVIHNRPDFMMMAMDQIVNHAAKWSYMFAGQVRVPIVIRACVGRGWGSAAQHSQSLHGLFHHVPGLKIVLPSTAYDAKGLLLASIADNNPVLFFEHRWLYKHRGHVPEHMYAVPLGQASIKREGRDVTIVALSHMVIESLRAAHELAADGISVEVVDPRTIRPLDWPVILRSVAKTGRLVVVDPAWHTGGFAAEVMAGVVEQGWGSLKRPPVRVTLPDASTPAGYALEQAFYFGVPQIIAAVRGMLGDG